jgi:hypothetical protein
MARQGPSESPPDRTRAWPLLGLSADGDPVNRPALIAPGVVASLSARAAPAADQDASETSAVIQAQAAPGFLAAAGMTKEVPPATVVGLPLLSLNDTAEMLRVGALALIRQPEAARRGVR